MDIKPPLFRNYQATNLAEAIYRGLYKQIRELISLQADPNERFKGYTSLSLCMFVQDKKWSKSILLQLLEAGARIDLHDYSNSEFNPHYNHTTPLHWAIVKGRTDLLTLLINALERNPLALKDQYGNTALHYAAWYPDRIEEMKLLIDYCKKFNYSIDALNKYGYSALVDAIRHLSFNDVDYLIEQGADLTIYNNLIENPNELLDKLRDKYNECKADYQRSQLRRSLQLNNVNNNKNKMDVNLLNLLERDINSCRNWWIKEAPKSDIRNNDIWVRDRPQSCYSFRSLFSTVMTSKIEQHSDETWPRIIPELMENLAEQQSKSYRKGINLEKLLLGLTATGIGGDGGGDGNSGRNKSNKRNGLNKTKPSLKKSDRLKKK